MLVRRYVLVRLDLNLDPERVDLDDPAAVHAGLGHEHPDIKLSTDEPYQRPTPVLLLEACNISRTQPKMPSV